MSANCVLFELLMSGHQFLFWFVNTFLKMWKNVYSRFLFFLERVGWVTVTTPIFFFALWYEASWLKLVHLRKVCG